MRFGPPVRHDAAYCPRCFVFRHPHIHLPFGWILERTGTADKPPGPDSPFYPLWLDQQESMRQAFREASGKIYQIDPTKPLTGQP